MPSIGCIQVGWYLFPSAVISDDAMIPIKADIFQGLSQLSEEFGFESLAAEL
jgi:hypothetical protein